MLIYFNDFLHTLIYNLVSFLPPLEEAKYIGFSNQTILIWKSYLNNVYKKPNGTIDLLRHRPQHQLCLR